MTQPVIPQEFVKHITTRMDAVEKKAQVAKTIAFVALWVGAVGVFLSFFLN